jgi:hypothetical protein
MRPTACRLLTSRIRDLRYRLGELLRESSDHILLLTATPHKGDPVNFSLFLQLLDADAFADVKSIREAMNQRRAPFYLRRTKEAMVHFPEQRPDGSWANGGRKGPTLLPMCFPTRFLGSNETAQSYLSL